MATINLQNDNFEKQVEIPVAQKTDINVNRLRRDSSWRIYLVSLFVFIVAVAIFQFSLAGKIATYGYEISYMQNTQDELLNELQLREVKLAEAITLEQLDNQLSGMKRVIAKEKTYTTQRLSDPVAYVGY